MMEKMKKFASSRKGFTLIEIIVVLVIIAILAAIAIPALTGYINKAKDKQIETETRTVYVAAQAATSDLYASNTSVTADKIKSDDLNKLIGEDLTAGNGDNTGTTDKSFTVTVSAEGKITKLVYTHNGKTATYENGSITVADATTTTTTTTHAG